MPAASAPVIAPPATGIDPARLPDVWRGSELARSRLPVTASGHAVLDAQLPGGGWPRSALVELLLQQSGIGEMQILQPALRTVAAQRPIALVQPPHVPHTRAAQAWGIDAARLLWLRAAKSADALWAAEQALKQGVCSAVLLWQSEIRAESLRRLHLAAQTSETLFLVFRPMACAAESSPALLRLGLRPAHGGVHVSILKRRGPSCDDALYVRLAGMPDRRHLPETNHASPVPQPVLAVAAAQRAASVLV